MGLLISTPFLLLDAAALAHALVRLRQGLALRDHPERRFLVWGAVGRPRARVVGFGYAGDLHGWFEC